MGFDKLTKFEAWMFWMEVWLMVLPLLTLFLGEKKSDSRWLFISALSNVTRCSIMAYELFAYHV